MGPLVSRTAEEMKCQVVGLDPGLHPLVCSMLVVCKSNSGGNHALRPGFCWKKWPSSSATWFTRGGQPGWPRNLLICLPTFVEEESGMVLCACQIISYDTRSISRKDRNCVCRMHEKNMRRISPRLLHVFIKTVVAGGTSSVRRTCTWTISMIRKIRNWSRAFSSVCGSFDKKNSTITKKSISVSARLKILFVLVALFFPRVEWRRSTT
jgi:hypothetical protein